MRLVYASILAYCFRTMYCVAYLDCFRYLNFFVKVPSAVWARNVDFANRISKGT